MLKLLLGAAIAAVAALFACRLAEEAAKAEHEMRIRGFGD